MFGPFNPANDTLRDMNGREIPRYPLKLGLKTWPTGS